MNGKILGGALATMYAAALPERTRALVVVDAYPDPAMTEGSLRVAEFIAARYRLGSDGLPPGFDPAIARRLAEDLESGALTYAEIKAIASGNPAVVEKIKIDTEIRKLDQLRAVHANQQRHIRWEIRDLPRHIAETKQRLAEMEGDIVRNTEHRVEAIHDDRMERRRH